MSDLVRAYQESLAPSRRSLVTRFRYAGMARKVVGVGSVGIRECVVMLLGRDDTDPLLVQVKEARAISPGELPRPERLPRRCRADGGRGAADVDSTMTPQLLADYGRSCGHVLARAHARTGDRIAIASYLGNGDTADLALTRFAEAYGEQNGRDYAALRAAAASDRLPQPS